MEAEFMQTIEHVEINLIPLLKRVNLIGLDFISAKSIDKVSEIIINAVINKQVRKDKIPLLFTPNVDIMVKIYRDEYLHLKEFLSQAEFILPDGQPIIWYSKIAGVPLASRLTGSDIFPYLWESINVNNISALFLTPNESISEYFTSNSKVTTCITLPFFNIDDDERINDIVKQSLNIIKTNNIRILIMGLSFPKEDKVAFQIYDALNKTYEKNSEMPYICLLGASMEFYLNHKRRAYKIFQKVGLEWFFRFCTEPKRLFKRYFIESISFIDIIKRDYKSR